MAIKASSHAIREMEKNLSDTIRDLERISNGIKGILHATSDWDDRQSQEFRTLMKRISELTIQPVEQLKSSIPKMEKLAQSLDEYGKIRF